MPRAGRPDRGGDGGYALIEVMFALVLIGLLAAVALPGLFRGTGQAALRVAAFHMSATLREDRNAAMRQNRIVTTVFGYDGVHSGASRLHVTLPSGTVLTAPPAIRFSPDGHSSGGNIVIAYAQARVYLNVSPDSGAIRVWTP